MGSTPLPSHASESLVGPRANKPALPALASERRIKRQNAFYHVSNAEEGPWKAPGGYYPHRDDTHLTRGRPMPERPISQSPSSIHPPVSRRHVLGSPGEGNHLLPPYSASRFRLPAPQGSRSSPSLSTSPLPQAKGAPTLPLPEATTTITTFLTQQAPTSRTPPLRKEGAFYHVSWFTRTPFRTPGPGVSQPPPYPPTTAPSASTTPLSSPKRKREDAGDTIDGDEALDKKRTRHPSPDGVD